MTQAADASAPTNQQLPIILIRGFGGLGVEDEKRLTHQGFETGTVYPQKRGENYIYEGLVLRFLKSGWRYQDATNVVGYYPGPVGHRPQIPEELKHLDARFFSDDRLVIDPGMALSLLRSGGDPLRSLWVFRYYDLNDRKFKTYGEALVRLIDFIRALVVEKDRVAPPKVNIIAHSMGGLIVREAIQRAYPAKSLRAADHINKVVTLGTPHQGISFQLLKDWLIPDIDAKDDLVHFSPEFQSKKVLSRGKSNPVSYLRFAEYFPPERLLTVVGTNYRAYNIKPSSWLNRLFAVGGEFGANYNRSDGLVKQAYAQLPGSPRTFVHKSHGGPDSLMTARESFEVATRFFFGDTWVKLKLLKGHVSRGKDLFGDSEFFLGVTIKPRGVDFELFHQSPEAENCYGPFTTVDFTDETPAFGWAGADKLVWEGWLDTRKIVDAVSAPKNLVLRIDVYVGERDLLGLGFSDNVVFRKQYYARAVLEPELKLYFYPDERFAQEGFQDEGEFAMTRRGGGWTFPVNGTGFEGVFQVEFGAVPETGGSGVSQSADR